MPVSSEARKAGPYTGNGVTVDFPFGFVVFDADEVLVVRTVAGVETTLVLTSDYTVTLNSDQSANPGGMVTMLVAPLNFHRITITSNLANLQPTQLTNLGGFYPEVINDSLDRATIQIQQIDERLDRALTIPLSSDNVSTALPAPVAGKILGWNPAGTGLQNYDAFSAATYVGAFAFILQSSVGVVRLLADGNFSPSSVTFSAFQDDGAGTRSAYAGLFRISTSVDGTSYTERYASIENESSKSYLVPSGANFVKCQLFRANDYADELQQFVVSVIRDGTDGSSGSGTDPVVVNLSKAAATVFAYADGTVPSFDGIDGQVTVFEGTANETASASFAIAGSGLTGEINTAVDTPVSGKPKGYYRVTAMADDIGALTITTTYGGVDYVRSFSVSKIRTGYEIVATLPSTNLFEGRLVFLTTDDKLYRYTGAAWTAAVAATDLTGQVVAAQISDAAITTAKFAASIEPISLVSSLPGSKTTNSVFNTTDGFLYRWNGTAYVKAVPAADVTGTLTNAQIADLAATKITGALTNAQIADLAATKITGALTNAQIADLAATKITGTLTNAQIADLAATKITGTLTNAQIADVAAAKITGAITETQIGTNAVTTAKISAGAVVTAKLAAGAVTASTIAAGAVETAKLAAGAVTANEISAGAVTTAKLAAGAVTANEIATNAITAVKINAGAVETAKIAAGAVTANEIGANAVTAVKINAGAVTTAKLAAGAVTANEIATNAITAVKISAGAVETAKLAAGAVTATTIAAGAVTTAKLAAGAVTASEIAANTITAGQIASGAIATDELAAGAVTAVKIAAGTITADKIAANTITAGQIAAATITATQLATNAITADKISAGAVTAAKISVTSLAAMSASTGNLSVSGTLTLGGSGKLITSGTTYNTNGIFLGEDGAGVYKFSIGGTSGRLTFDGTNLSLPGGRLVDGSVGATKLSVSQLSAISADIGSITAGKLSLTSGSYVVRHGAGFGASSDLVLWYGLSSVAEASATKTNGVFALATDGKVYYGAAELTGGVEPISITRTNGFVKTRIGNGTNTTNSVSFSAIGGSGSYTFTHELAIGSTSGPTPSLSSSSGSPITVSATGVVGDEVYGTVITTATDGAGRKAQITSPLALFWEL